MVKYVKSVVLLFVWNFAVEGYEFNKCYDVSALSGMSSFQKPYIPPGSSFPSTTIDCMSVCLNINYKYAATKLHDILNFDCYCGNDIQFTDIAPDTDCGIPCPLTATDRCGKNNRLAVYLVAGDTSPITVQQIFQQETTKDVAYTTVVSSTSHQSTIMSTKAQECTTQTEVPTSRATTSRSVQTITTVKAESNVNSTCYCPCNTVSNKWDFLSNGTYTIDELKVLLRDNLEELERQVAIDKSQTLSSIYKKRCMEDGRPSSKVMGFFGAIMISIPVVLIVISDCGAVLCRQNGKYWFK